jgi:glycosyltransferase involved in cell wall biosynthesis
MRDDRARPSHDDRNPDGRPDEAPASDVAHVIAEERARADAAARDARRAERETRDVSARLRETSRELRDVKGQLASVQHELAEERRRFAALRKRRSVRIALAITHPRAAFSRLRARRRGRPAEPMNSHGSTAGLDDTMSQTEQYSRALPERYRNTAVHRIREPDQNGLRIAVIDGSATRSPQMDEALRDSGFDVTNVARPDQVPVACDVVVALDPAIDPLALPANPIRVRAVGGPINATAMTRDWDIEIPMPGSAVGSLLVSALEKWIRAPRVAIRISATGALQAPNWGDTYFARDLCVAFRQIGWSPRIYLHRDWAEPGVARNDMVIDVVGPYVPATVPGACRILWQISHPEMASAELYALYDVVFVASDPFATLMSRDTGFAVLPLHQATDPDRFRPVAEGPETDLLFVGNWRPDRHVVADLLPTTHHLAVYGRGWEPDRLEPRYHAGESISNEELGGAYARARIVLNDHAQGMRREGFLSNRLYDASAAGAFVITDEVDGLREEFGGGIVSYRHRDELHALVERYLASPAERRAMSERARDAVLTRHTFAHRARQLTEAAAPILGNAVLQTWESPAIVR